MIQKLVLLESLCARGKLIPAAVDDVIIAVIDDELAQAVVESSDLLKDASEEELRNFSGDGHISQDNEKDDSNTFFTDETPRTPPIDDRIEV